MTLYETLKEEIDERTLTTEQKAKLRSVKELDKLKQLTRKVVVSSDRYPEELED